MQSARLASGEPRLSQLRRTFGAQQWGIILVLVGMIVILGITVPVFLSPRNIRNILQQVSTLGILSMGMTVLMVSGGIDLSVGRPRCGGRPHGAGTGERHGAAQRAPGRLY